MSLFDNIKIPFQLDKQIVIIETLLKKRSSKKHYFLPVVMPTGTGLFIRFCLYMIRHRSNKKTNNSAMTKAVTA